LFNSGIIASRTAGKGYCHAARYRRRNRRRLIGIDRSSAMVALARAGVRSVRI
jgi:hypothetical protein